MDAKIKFPFNVTAFIIGAIFIFAGFGISVPIYGKDIGLNSIWLKIFSFLIGIIIIIFLLYAEFIRKNSVKDKLVHVNSSNPSASSFFSTVHQRDVSFDDLVSDAAEVWISGITAVNLLSSYQNTFENLLREGCKLKLMFLDPNSEAAKIVYGGKHERYINNIKSSLEVLKYLYHLGDGKISIKAMIHAPTVSMIFVNKRKHKDEESFVQVQLYFLRAAIGANRPIFRVSRRDKWFPLFHREFEELWNSSPNWEWSRVDLL